MQSILQDFWKDSVSAQFNFKNTSREKFFSKGEIINLEKQVMLSKDIKLISDIYMFGFGIKFMIPEAFPLFESFSK